MHTLYWRDLESPANGEWLGLVVQVEGGGPGARRGECGKSGRRPPRPPGGGGGGPPPPRGSQYTSCWVL